MRNIEAGAGRGTGSDKITRYHYLLSQHGVLRTFARRQLFFSESLRWPLLTSDSCFFTRTEGTFTSTSAPQRLFGLECIELYTTMLRPGAGKRAGQGGERKGRLAKRRRPETNRAGTP